jgi:hypothetical protein
MAAKACTPTTKVNDSGYSHKCSFKFPSIHMAVQVPPKVTDLGPVGVPILSHLTLFGVDAGIMPTCVQHNNNNILNEVDPSFDERARQPLSAKLSVPDHDNQSHDLGEETTTQIESFVSAAMSRRRCSRRWRLRSRASAREGPRGVVGMSPPLAAVPPELPQGMQQLYAAGGVRGIVKLSIGGVIGGCSSWCCCC